LRKEKKRKFEEVKEISEIVFLRDAPVSKILKVGPAPRPALPLPLSIKPTKPKKKRARSISPTPEKFSFLKSFTSEEKKLIGNQNQIQSHSPQPQPQPSPLVNRRPAGNWKKRKKR